MENYPDDLTSLYTAIGRIVVQWALAEQSLDIGITIIFDHFNGRNLSHKQEFPRSLKRKLELLEDCVTQIPELAEFKSDGLSLSSKFKTLSQTRHDYIHGALEELEPQDGVFKFIRIKYGNYGHQLTPVSFDVRDFPRLLDQLGDLAGDVSQFSRRLLDMVPDAR